MRATMGERALWRAVICNALDEAVGLVVGRPETMAWSMRDGSRKTVTNHEFARTVAVARAWFRRAGPDFQDVCAHADTEPLAVRAVALERISAADEGRLVGQRSLMSVLSEGRGRAVEDGYDDADDMSEFDPASQDAPPSSSSREWCAGGSQARSAV